MADETLPMNGLEEVAPLPASDQGAEAPPPQNDQRERDEGGRFAPKEPKGQPSQEAARRREAQERDEARAENARLRGEQEKWTKRFADMETLLKGEQEQPKHDPLADLSGKVDKLLGTFEQQQNDRETEAAWQQVRSFADADEAAFVQEKPDLPQAVEHYIYSRLREMKAIGLNQEQAEQSLQQEAQQLLIRCAQTGTRPAATMYAMAEARGYAGGGAPQQRQEVPMRPAAPAGGRSLGTGSGAGTGGLTAASIANMSDDDYFSLRNTPEGKAAIRRAMGG